MAEKEVYEYTYSAPQNTEVQKIRAKYLPKEVTKLEQLRSLDREVTRRGTAVSLIHGSLFSLLLGLGMSCCMVWGAALFVPGILVGCVGLAGVAVTYPLYTRIVQKDRERIAPEILRLSDELISGNKPA